MSDRELRELERRWNETRDPADHQRYLTALRRTRGGQAPWSSLHGPDGTRRSPCPGPARGVIGARWVQPKDDPDGQRLGLVLVGLDGRVAVLLPRGVLLLDEELRLQRRVGDWSVRPACLLTLRNGGFVGAGGVYVRNLDGGEVDLLDPLGGASLRGAIEARDGTLLLWSGYGMIRLSPALEFLEVVRQPVRDGSADALHLVAGANEVIFAGCARRAGYLDRPTQHWAQLAGFTLEGAVRFHLERAPERDVWLPTNSGQGVRLAALPAGGVVLAESGLGAWTAEGEGLLRVSDPGAGPPLVVLPDPCRLVYGLGGSTHSSAFRQQGTSLVERLLPAPGSEPSPAKPVFDLGQPIVGLAADVDDNLYLATEYEVLGLDPARRIRFRHHVRELLPHGVKDLALGDGFLLVRGYRELLRIE